MQSFIERHVQLRAVQDELDPDALRSRVMANPPTERPKVYATVRRVAREMVAARTMTGWAFVQEHYAYITKRVSFQAQSSGLDEADLLQGTILRIAERHFRFDATEGTAKTWIFWQVRRVATDQTRTRGFGREVYCSMSPDEPDVLGMMSDHDSDRHIEAAAEAALLLNNATAAEAAAIQSKVEGWDPEEIEARLGIGAPGRNRRIARFRAKLRGEEKSHV